MTKSNFLYWVVTIAILQGGCHRIQNKSSLVEKTLDKQIIPIHSVKDKNIIIPQPNQNINATKTWTTFKVIKLVSTCALAICSGTGLYKYFVKISNINNDYDVNAHLHRNLGAILNTTNSPTTAEPTTPTLDPSLYPTLYPTIPTIHPTLFPTYYPTNNTLIPTLRPTPIPTPPPTFSPTNRDKRRKKRRGKYVTIGVLSTIGGICLIGAVTYCLSPCCINYCCHKNKEQIFGIELD